MKALNEGELQLEHDPTTFMCSLITSSCVHLLILCIAFPTKLLECLKLEIEHQKEDKIIERKKDTMNWKFLERIQKYPVRMNLVEMPTEKTHQKWWFKGQLVANFTDI